VLHEIIVKPIMKHTKVYATHILDRSHVHTHTHTHTHMMHAHMYTNMYTHAHEQF